MADLDPEVENERNATLERNGRSYRYLDRTIYGAQLLFTLAIFAVLVLVIIFSLAEIATRLTLRTRIDADIVDAITKIDQGVIARAGRELVFDFTAPPPAPIQI